MLSWVMCGGEGCGRMPTGSEKARSGKFFEPCRVACHSGSKAAVLLFQSNFSQNHINSFRGRLVIAFTTPRITAAGTES